jgi:hypothetical protein
VCTFFPADPLDTTGFSGGGDTKADAMHELLSRGGPMASRDIAAALGWPDTAPVRLALKRQPAVFVRTTARGPAASASRPPPPPPHVPPYGAALCCPPELVLGRHPADPRWPLRGRRRMVS